MPTHNVMAGVVPLFGNEDAVTRLDQIERGQDVGKKQHGHRSIIAEPAGGYSTPTPGNAPAISTVPISGCSPTNSTMAAQQ
ncbi:hypothetical protein GCM10009632_23310 [Mycolicibacterium alvei]|uniref:Uncharacterized protein n=1 Tax=Mycolicibacterium alvei TaxID=67081 RepID=A0A6N4UP60_9MYCO|nr:hypothetical protein MALV_04460 [Mycolicibacterium alvei]